MNGWLNTTSVSVQRYFLFSSLALVITFAWIEPSGAAGIGFWRGLLFWTIQIAILIPLLIAVQHFTSHYVRFSSPQAPWLQTSLAGIVASLLFVPVALFLDVLFGIPEDAQGGGLFFKLLDEASGVVVPVIVTWLALNAPWIFQLDFTRRQSADAPAQEGAEKERCANQEEPSGRFLQELRSRLSGELVSISSELHYLRVTTTDGEVMFLYNLRDAIEELPADTGVQIHRSHWVSRAHLRTVTKKNGIAEVTLANGKSLPVSRRKYSEVKELLSVRVPEHRLAVNT